MVDLLPHCIGSEKIIDATASRRSIENPADGCVIAELAIANAQICDQAVISARDAFVAWSDTPPLKKMQILFQFRDILIERQSILAAVVTREHGKTLEDAKGSIARGIELVEFHCGLLSQVQGSWSANVSRNIDCHTMRVPLGVCAGASPFNFPVMVPLWMIIPAIACGNTFVLKPSEQTPSAANLLLAYLLEAGLPPGVVNVVHGDKTTVECLLRHPEIRGFTAVASTPVAESIYQTAIAQGKRSMTFGGAKNHAVVMPDADLDETAKALIGAAFGSAGERCMAISVVVAVTDALADALCTRLASLTQSIRVDSGESLNCDMGPLISAKHRERVLKLIQEGVDAGAQLVVDGRDFQHPRFPNGFYLGPCLFDHVTEAMSIYQEEIFGPVLVMMRVSSLEEALAVINRNMYGNGTAIFTATGYDAREFSRLVHVGMVGINVPIPVPIASHPFGGWKRSSFGDHGMHGAESIHFYTKSKTITSKWTAHQMTSDTPNKQQTFSMPTNRGDAS